MSTSTVGKYQNMVIKHNVSWYKTCYMQYNIFYYSYNKNSNSNNHVSAQRIVFIVFPSIKNSIIQSKSSRSLIK